MNAFTPQMQAHTADASKPVSTTAMRWSALHDAGNVVATLAGLASTIMDEAVEQFPDLIQEVGGWRLDHTEKAISDLAAVMEPGIKALLSVNARGADPQPAAKALWQEFECARDAVLALLPPAESRKMAASA